MKRPDVYSILSPDDIKPHPGRIPSGLKRLDPKKLRHIMTDKCGRCPACVRGGGTSAEDCRWVAIREGALGGHQGSQVAFLQELAVDMQVLVWWDLEKEWFAGTITSYDQQKHEHHVDYEDTDK